MVVRAIMIVEMAGRPPAHLKESLENHIKILNDVDDITVHSIKVSEPTEIKIGEHEGVPAGEPMFTAFAEADFECDNFARLSETMFDFMPSSVEVIEPGKVTMDMGEATNLLNNISGRMHRYDEIAKVAKIKIDQLTRQVQVAAKVLEDNGLAKDGKLVPAVVKKLMAGENEAVKKVGEKKSGKKKKKSGKKVVAGKKKVKK